MAAEPAPAAGKPPAGMNVLYSPRPEDRWQDLLSRQPMPATIEAILTGSMDGDVAQMERLFQQMCDTWPRFAKNCEKLRGAVAGAPWVVNAWAEEGDEPSESAQERAKFTSRAWWKMRPDPTRHQLGARETLERLADAWVCGHTVCEIHWTRNAAGEICPTHTVALPARYYGWPSVSGEADVLRFRPDGRSSNLVPFPEDKFLFAVCPSHSGHPAVSARFRSLAKYWVAVTYGLQWLMQHAQLFGIPTRVAKYVASDKATFNAVCSMMRNLGAANWGVFPEGTEITFHSDSRSAATLPQMVLQELADKTCDILLIGQSLTTDTGKGGGGSYALGQVHEGVERDVLQRACNAVASVLTHQFAPSLLRLNYGDAEESPEFCALIPEPVDEQAMINRDTALLKIPGVRVAKSWFYDRHNIPMPEDDDEVLEGEPEAEPAAPGAPGVPPQDEADDDDDAAAAAAAVGEPFDQADYTKALAEFMEVLLLKGAVDGARRGDEQFTEDKK